MSPLSLSWLLNSLDQSEEYVTVLPLDSRRSTWSLSQTSCRSGRSTDSHCPGLQREGTHTHTHTLISWAKTKMRHGDLMDDKGNLMSEVRCEQGRNRLTVDKHLLLLGQDADQVGAMEPTLPLSGVPGPTVYDVFVAVGLKLVPAKFTQLWVCRNRKATACSKKVTKKAECMILSENVNVPFERLLVRSTQIILRHNRVSLLHVFFTTLHYYIVQWFPKLGSGS